MTLGTALFLTLTHLSVSLWSSTLVPVHPSIIWNQSTCTVPLLDAHAMPFHAMPCQSLIRPNINASSHRAIFDVAAPFTAAARDNRKRFVRRNTVKETVGGGLDQQRRQKMKNPTPDAAPTCCGSVSYHYMQMAVCYNILWIGRI